jgi:F-type H+-transporting ATPase subunit alpha
LVELLKQPLNSPMPVEEQVVSIFAGTTGVLDDLPFDDVKRFENELLDYFRGPHADMLAQIRTTGVVPEGDTLATAVADFKSRFVVTGSTAGAA